MDEYEIAVIGGGPAGIMAAIAASQNSSSVILLEKNSKLGRKLLMSGGGRCNITNAKPIKKLLKFYPQKNFLKHSFYTLTNEKLLSFFENKGLRNEELIEWSKKYKVHHLRMNYNGANYQRKESKSDEVLIINY